MDLVNRISILLVEDTEKATHLWQVTENLIP